MANRSSHLLLFAGAIGLILLMRSSKANASAPVPAATEPRDSEQDAANAAAKAAQAQEDRALPPPVAPSAPSEPSGYDPDKARRTSAAMADHLRRKKYDYKRSLLKAWQTAAGVTADGIYGGVTRGALLHFGGSEAPEPLFKPTETVPYRPRE